MCGDTQQSGVWFLSTCHDGHESEEVCRQKRGSASLMKTASIVAIDYKYMGGCDRANSLRASYNTYLTHKKRRYMSLFYYGIDVLLVNAFIYYNSTHYSTQLAHKAFRLRVIQLFAARSLNRQRSATEDERGPRRRCNSDTLGPERQLPSLKRVNACVWCYHNTKKRRHLIVQVCTTC